MPLAIFFLGKPPAAFERANEVRMLSEVQAAKRLQLDDRVKAKRHAGVRYSFVWQNFGTCPKGHVPNFEHTRYNLINCKINPALLKKQSGLNLFNTFL